MCMTLLKHQCRLHNITRWPYRQVDAILCRNAPLKREQEAAACRGTAAKSAFHAYILRNRSKLLKHSKAAARAAKNKAMREKRRSSAYAGVAGGGAATAAVQVPGGAGPRADVPVGATAAATAEPARRAETTSEAASMPAR